MRNLLKSSVLLLAASVSLGAWGAMSPEADSAPDGTSPSAGVLGGRGPEAALALPASLPRMAPELALQTFEQHAARQLNAPVSYSANTVIEAELPDTAQRGRFQLRRRFIAPKTLLFTPVRFVGDNFVKSNVIARLLQAEVAHVGKDESTRTAISEANYKFSYKGMGEIDGRPMHVFHVKPRHKRPGLFKGRIYLDASTGSLRRTEGTLVKTDSFFVKRIEFAQDYADIEGYTLPVHASSVAKTRLVGRALVEIATDDYDLSSTAASAATLAVSGDQ